MQYIQEQLKDDAELQKCLPDIFKASYEYKLNLTKIRKENLLHLEQPFLITEPVPKESDQDAIDLLRDEDMFFNKMLEFIQK